MQVHTTQIISQVQYGKLKTDGIVPKISMFTDVPKVGGNFPKYATKIDPCIFGLLIDRIYRLVLQNRQLNPDILESAVEMVNQHIRPKGDDIIDIESVYNEYDYYNKLADWILDNICEDSNNIYEPEWIYKNVMGHPDLIIDDTIYDIKTTGRWGRMRIHTILQVLSYAALSKHNNIDIKYVGVILPCQNIILKYDISSWDSRKYLDLLQDKALHIKNMKSIDKGIVDNFTKNIRPFIGSHVPKESTMYKTVIQLEPNQPIQIFLGSNIKPTFKAISKKDLSNTLEYINQNNKLVYVHTPYTLNICRLSLGNNKHKDNLDIDDVLVKFLETTSSFGGKGCVVHIGNKVEMPYNIAYDNMMTNVSLAASFATPDCPLLIETHSGGSILDDPINLADFWFDIDENIRPNVAICLDTCHVFAAGFDSLEALNMFKRRGVPVNLIHYNDSVFDKGSRKDRHAGIGKGMIGLEYLAGVAEYAITHNIPMVYE